MPSRMNESDGHYFHKQHEGARTAIVPADEQVAAVIQVARHRQDADDFEQLVDMLGLGDARDRLRRTA